MAIRHAKTPMQRHYFAYFGRKISRLPTFRRKERPRPACDPHDFPLLSLTSLVLRRDPRRKHPPVTALATSGLELACIESFLEEIVSTLKHAWGVEESFPSGSRSCVIPLGYASVRTR
jgi:hypothetical protein